MRDKENIFLRSEFSVLSSGCVQALVYQALAAWKWQCLRLAAWKWQCIKLRLRRSGSVLGCAVRRSGSVLSCVVQDKPSQIFSYALPPNSAPIAKKISSKQLLR